jgi:Xaa-Pro aminopeptidase
MATVSDVSEEFRERRNAATRAAAARDLKALLVCSRGGGTLDRYADVMYLTGFYTPFPFIPDRRPLWSARAHAFLLLLVEAGPVLLADVRYQPTPETGETEIVVASDMIAALIAELRKRGLVRGTVGLVGTDTIPWSTMQQLDAEFPDITWSPADDILEDLRSVKSPREIALLRQASAIGSHAMDAMLDSARPGATHADVVRAGQDVLVPAGAILQNSFMSSGRGGDQPTEVSSSFPTYGAPTPLAAGDWFHVGLSGVYQGYYFDMARSSAIGDVSPGQADAFEAAIACVQAAIAAIRPGVTAEAIAEAGRARLEAIGYALEGSFSGLGHGIGLGWDKPWLMPGDTTAVQPGMVLCVERGVRREGFYGDFEETVLVTDSGTDLLTSARVRRW